MFGSIPVDFTGIFNLPNPASRNMALWSTQPLTGISTRNLLSVKGRPARKHDNLIANCELIVYKMWEILSYNPVGLHSLLQG
jgi:hypothetical protein